MKKYTDAVIAIGFSAAVLISQVVSFFRDGDSLEHIRGNVLRLHILADSDGPRDQELKLKVRDELLESGLLSEADSLADAEEEVRGHIPEIELLAEDVLRHNGCDKKVRAYLTEMHFDKRVYGDITMPEGDYHALRIEIGSAKGHNWWCVMYPPLCLPAACEVTDDKEKDKDFFDEKELDILRKPEKYEVRFAIWDKICDIKDKMVVQSDEIQPTT